MVVDITNTNVSILDSLPEDGVEEEYFNFWR